MVPRTLILQYMNVHRAIIVPMSGDPHHVPLPSITFADMKIFKDRFTRAIRYSSRMNPGESRTDLIVLLQIINQVMLPITNVLHSPVSNKGGSFWEGAMPGRQLIKKRVPPSFVAIGQGQLGAGKDKALLAVDSATMSVSLFISSFLQRPTAPLFLVTKPHEHVHSKPCSRIPGCTLLVMASRTLRSLIIRHERRTSDAARYHGETSSACRVCVLIGLSYCCRR